MLENLQVFPAVAILGPRQCGKSTLAKMIYRESTDFLYLDLQSVEDRNKLNEPRLFFEANRDAIICLDEIQLIPELFAILRSEIDRNRRPGRFILLDRPQGPGAKDLESLAGRVGMIELTPFTLEEVEQEDAFELNRYWVRGGYPDSYLAASDSGSVLWRRTSLEHTWKGISLNWDFKSPRFRFGGC